MAKAKMTISLDEDIKEMLTNIAKRKHMTVSGLITQFTLSEIKKESHQTKKDGK